MLQPGTGYSMRSDCVHADLIARTEDGDEYARWEAPICRGDGPWMITGPDPESTPET